MAQSEKALKSVQTWLLGFSTLYSYTKFGMASRHTRAISSLQAYHPNLQDDMLVHVRHSLLLHPVTS